jgi:FMN reductase
MTSSSLDSPGAATADVVVLIGNPRAGSRTRALADAATEALLARLATASSEPWGVQVLELAELVGVTFGPEPVYGSATVADPFALVRSARLLVVATPTYKGSYTGLLKIFVDQFGPAALSRTVAVPVAVAASDAHLRAVATALTGLLVELGACVPAAPLAVLESHLADLYDVAAEWADAQAGAVAGALAGRRVAA